MYFCSWNIMSKKENTALVLGATGLIGKELLSYLLQNNKYDTVYAVSRKPLGFKNDKLINIVADQNTIENYIKDIHVDHFFNCLGTTKSKTPDPKEYYKIDLEYPIEVAKALKENGCNNINIVSSIGTNPQSKNFYLRLKSDMETAFINLNFSSTSIFRPSILLGKRNEKRFLEDISKAIMHIINFFLIGNLRNYKSIKAKTVATAMVNIALSNKLGTHIYLTEEIKKNT